jgi:transcription initiation factor TFIIA large subunit
MRACPENVIACQYEKVGRTKARWKMTLRDGVMRVNGRDYCFKTAIGDCSWA